MINGCRHSDEFKFHLKIHVTAGQGRRSHRIIGGGHKRSVGRGSGGRSPPAGSRGGAPVGDPRS